MSEGGVGPNGTHFRFYFKDDQGVLTAARLPLGSRTDQEFATLAATLKTAYPTLRQWASDAATVNTNWPTMTAAQKDTAMRTAIQRLGLFLDRFGDLLQALNADS